MYADLVELRLAISYAAIARPVGDSVGHVLLLRRPAKIAEVVVVAAAVVVGGHVLGRWRRADKRERNEAVNGRAGPPIPPPEVDLQVPRFHVADVRMTDIVERLRDSKHKVVDFNRTYDHDADWIDNALREHADRPFRAIICDAGRAACTEAMEPDDCSDAHALFGATTSCDVIRTADEIAEALHTITAVSKEVDIVDPYFDLRLTKGNYLATLVSLLGRLARDPGQSKAIRIHFRDHDTRPSAEVLARDGSAHVRGLLPHGYNIELFAWSEKLGGEDFHDRYVLTDLGGIMIGAGLSADGPGESAAFTLLNVEHAQGLRSRFSYGSTVYSRVGSAVRIRDDGSTELF